MVLSDLRKGGSIAVLLVAAAALAGCGTRPAAPCAEKGDYPLPSTLCTPFPKKGFAAPASLAAAEPATTGSLEPAVPSAADTRQSVPSVLRALISSNPDVGIAAAKEKEQYAAIGSARAEMLPTLDFTAAAGPQQNWLSDPEGHAVRREVGFSLRQNIYDFGGARSSYKRAALAYASATSARVAQTEQTAFSMLDLLMKVQEIDDNIALARRNIAAHERILRIVKSNEADGNSTVADVKRVTTRLENARTTLIDLTTERTNAADAFRRLTDLDVDGVSDAVTPKLAGGAGSISDADLAGSPDLAALQSEIDALRAQLDAVGATGLPSLGLESSFKVGRQLSEPVDSDRRMYGNVLVSLKVPLLDGGANLSAREQVMARIEAATLKLDKRRRELREEAQGAMRITASDPEKSGSLAERVSAAKKVQELYFEQFTDGGRTIFELLDAQVDLVKAEMELISQRFSRRRAQIEKLLLKGTLVRDVLAQG